MYIQILVLSAALIGLLKVLESLLHKLHSLAHTVNLSSDLLQLLATLLPGHVDQLLDNHLHEHVKYIVCAVLGVIRQMKESKVGVLSLIADTCSGVVASFEKLSIKEVVY